MKQKESTNNDVCGKGSLWKKKTRTGKQYLSGMVIIRNKDGIEQSFHINVFTNDNKINGSSTPDFNMVVYPFNSLDGSNLG